jgi:hypothetical protein
MSLKEFIIGVFIFMPIITLIHEFGHVFFAKIFGAEIKKIVIGSGKTFLTLGKFEVKTMYFWFGYFQADKLGNSKLAKIVTLLGGTIFNLASCLIIIILLYINIINNNNLIRLFIGFSLYTIIAALIPIKYFNDTNSDGLQVCQVIKKGSSNFYNKKQI